MASQAKPSTHRTLDWDAITPLSERQRQGVLELKDACADLPLPPNASVSSFIDVEARCFKKHSRSLVMALDLTLTSLHILPLVCCRDQLSSAFCQVRKYSRRLAASQCVVGSQATWTVSAPHAFTFIVTEINSGKGTKHASTFQAWEHRSSRWDHCGES